MKFANLQRFRTFRAIFHTIDGIKVLWNEEHAFRLEIYIGIVLLPLLIIVHVSSMLKLILVLLMLLLITIEIVNSAIEAVVDRISLEPHTQSKIAKDMGSAAVGMVIIMNVLAWIYAFYIHFTS